MTHRPMKFDKEYAIIQLIDMKKQGYCSIKAMPTWLRNEYRELTLQQAVDIVNEWIVDYKIEHEKLVIFTSNKTDYVLTETQYNKTMTILNQLRAERRKAQ